MIGGYVVDIIEKDTYYSLEIRSSEKGRKDRCIVEVEKQKNFDPHFGDAVWWQSKETLWTPKSDGTGRRDVRLKRIRFTGAKNPLDEN